MERARRGRAWQPSGSLLILVALGVVATLAVALLAAVEGREGASDRPSRGGAPPTGANQQSAGPKPGPLDADATLPAELDGRRLEPVAGHEGRVLVLSERDVWPGSGTPAPQAPLQTDQQFLLWDPLSGDTSVAWTRTDSFREMVLGMEGDWVVSVPYRGTLMDWQVLLRNVATGETREIASHDPRSSVAGASPDLGRYQATHWGDLAGDALPVMSDGRVTWVQTVVDDGGRVRQRVLLHTIESGATTVAFEVAEPRQLDENGDWTTGGHAWSASVGGGTLAWVYQASPDEAAQLLVHDVATGGTAPLELPQEPTGVAVSGEGSPTLAVTVEGGILLVTPATGEVREAPDVPSLPAGHRVYFSGRYLWWRPPPPTPQPAGVLDLEGGDTLMTESPTHSALVAGDWFVWQERGADERPQFWHFVRLGD